MSLAFIAKIKAYLKRIKLLDAAAFTANSSQLWRAITPHTQSFHGLQQKFSVRVEVSKKSLICILKACWD